MTSIEKERRRFVRNEVGYGSCPVCVGGGGVGIISMVNLSFVLRNIGRLFSV